jgi:hypothetical protein
MSVTGDLASYAAIDFGTQIVDGTILVPPASPVSRDIQDCQGQTPLGDR